MILLHILSALKTHFLHVKRKMCLPNRLRIAYNSFTEDEATPDHRR
jgi:hypothetical protein